MSNLGNIWNGLTSLAGYNKPKIYVLHNGEKRTEKQIESAIIDLEQQVYRQRQSIGLYRSSVEQAESIESPNRYDLYSIYKTISGDNHLSAIIQTRKNLTIGRRFQVFDKAGKFDEKKTELLQDKGFYDYVSLCLDSVFWGHSLIQFETRVGDYFKGVHLIPRQHVVPEKHIIVKHISDQTGLDYTDVKYKNWVSNIGEARNLGLLMKAAPMVIWKNGALGAWAEYQEIFGMPLRVGTTNASDTKSQAAFASKLENMGVAQWMMKTKHEEVEFKEAVRTDAHNVYNVMIERLNSELSKLVLGQTMTTDSGSSRSQAEVHERILSQVMRQDERFIEGVFKYDLVPKLVYHNILSDGDRILADNAEDLSLLDKVKIDDVLMKYWDLDPEELKADYGRTVTPKEQKAIGDPNIKNYYNG